MVMEKIKDIPRLPQVSMELMRIAFQEEPDIQKIASIVEKDPSLATRLFKTVNSAAFGLKVEVTSISQVISIIGLNALKSTVVTLALGEYFVSSSLGNVLNPKEFCTHSLATAVIMKKAAQGLGIKEAPQLYLLGLLHDLGTIALDSLQEPSYEQVVRSMEGGKSQSEAEKAVFGHDSHEVWNTLAEDWEFPTEIVELLNKTFKHDKQEITTLKLVQDASRMADTMGFPCYTYTGPETQSEEADVFSYLDNKVMREISDSVTMQVQAVSEVLDLPTPSESQMNASLLKIARQLSLVSADNIRKSRELEFRINMLRELRDVIRGITKTFDSNSLSFSVLEALTAGFNADSAFLLTQNKRGQLAGYSAKIHDKDDVSVDNISSTLDEVSPVLKPCFKDASSAHKLADFKGDAFMESLIGDVSLAWVSTLKSHTKDRVSGIVGIGLKDKDSFKFNSSDFGETFQVAASEIGFALENARLYNIVLKESRFDPLTNLFNRRTIMKILATEFARFKRKPRPLSVVIFDLDNFKSINDTMGHLAGDEYLKKISVLLKRGVRDSDYIGRYGGDEFFGIFPETPASKVHVVVERVRKVIKKFCVEFGGKELGDLLSVSAGITAASTSMNHSDDLIQQADTALYAAKEKGRNQCVVLEEAPEPSPAS